MAKAKAKKEESTTPKKGLDIKVKLDKSESGRITITVSLLEDGKVIASDYDFVNI